ncbi:hypothetical protein I4U23_026400 [Adineta vaga]|nr:hypothetical protein I4U23_026400 [Adineta vaga]
MYFISIYFLSKMLTTLSDQTNYERTNNKKCIPNDVIVFKDENYVFKIGKINKTINDDRHEVMIFHYKLENKMEIIMDENVLLRFGNIGSKKIFDLDKKQQEQLLNKLNQINYETGPSLPVFSNLNDKDDTI